MGRTMTMATRFERIDAAIDVMEHPEDFLAQWDMSTFGNQENTVDGTLLYDKPERCNTAACFAGNLSLAPTFRRLGFRGYWYDGELHLGKEDAAEQSWCRGLVKVLGITLGEAECLVSPCATELDSRYLQNLDACKDITPEQVVARLGRLRKRYEKIEAEEGAGSG